jgi:hypothetical protein
VVIPGQCPPGMAPELAGVGVAAVPVEPDVPVEPVLEEPVEPELVVPELVAVVGVEVAALATVVPTPARTPDMSSPAITCFVRSFMVYLPRFLGRPSGTFSILRRSTADPL